MSKIDKIKERIAGLIHDLQDAFEDLSVAQDDAETDAFANGKEEGIRETEG